MQNQLFLNKFSTIDILFRNAGNIIKKGIDQNKNAQFNNNYQKLKI